MQKGPKDSEQCKRVELEDKRLEIRVFKDLEEEDSSILRHNQQVRPVLMEIQLQEDQTVSLDNLFNVPITLPVKEKTTTRTAKCCLGTEKRWHSEYRNKQHKEMDLPKRDRKGTNVEREIAGFSDDKRR